MSALEPLDAAREARIQAIAQELARMPMCHAARKLAAELSKLVKERPASVVAMLERERGLR